MTVNKPIRVVLADDHALVLEGLRTLISTDPDLRLVATATDGERLLEAIRRFHPAVAVMDLQMPYLGGADCLRKIRAEDLPVRVLILTAFGDAHSMHMAIEGGADGLALKTDPPETTLAAIRQVAAGHLVFPQAARRWLMHAAKPEPDPLTPREQEMLALLAEGKSNLQIARDLHLTENTVKFHLRNIYAKLGVANRTEAAARYHKRA
jgi:DNA-binding NarL/FixJ family response regulator